MAHALSWLSKVRIGFCVHLYIFVCASRPDVEAYEGLSSGCTVLAPRRRALHCFACALELLGLTLTPFRRPRVKTTTTSSACRRCVAHCWPLETGSGELKNLCRPVVPLCATVRAVIAAHDSDETVAKQLPLHAHHRGLIHSAAPVSFSEPQVQKQTLGTISTSLNLKDISLSDYEKPHHSRSPERTHGDWLAAKPAAQSVPPSGAPPDAKLACPRGALRVC